MKRVIAVVAVVALVGATTASAQWVRGKSGGGGSPLHHAQ